MNLDPYRIAAEPYYQPLGNEGPDLSGGLCRAPAGHAQGTDRMRQDAVHRAHGWQLGNP